MEIFPGVEIFAICDALTRTITLKCPLENRELREEEMKVLNEVIPDITQKYTGKTMNNDVLACMGREIKESVLSKCSERNIIPRSSMKKMTEKQADEIKDFFQFEEVYWKPLVGGTRYFGI